MMKVTIESHRNDSHRRSDPADEKFTAEVVDGPLSLRGTRYYAETADAAYEEARQDCVRKLGTRSSRANFLHART